jgi:hypothetical protein
MRQILRGVSKEPEQKAVASESENPNGTQAPNIIFRSQKNSARDKLESLRWVIVGAKHRFIYNKHPEVKKLREQFRLNIQEAYSLKQTIKSLQRSQSDKELLKHSTQLLY